MTKSGNFNLSSLILDTENPRISNVANQNEALNRLIEINPKQFETLMTSIRDFGLDPGDRLYVTKANSDEQYIVLEGNRRIAALKVLSKPELLDELDLQERVKKSLKEIASECDVSDNQPIECVEFQDRTQAKKWILRRHEGIRGGEGRINWGPLEIQRFTGDHSIIDILDFVEEKEKDDFPNWNEVRSDIEKRKSSNLYRLIYSATGKSHIGIELKNQNDIAIPLLSRKPDWASKVLKKIVQDVYDGVVNSRSHNRNEDINDYFEKLPENLQPTGEEVKSIPFREITSYSKTSSGKTKAKTKTKTKTKTKGIPKQRTNLIPKNITFNVPSPERSRQVFREASKIDIRKFGLSATFLLRAIIELTVNEYIKNNPNILKKESKKSKQETLTTKLNVVIQDIENNNIRKKSELNAIRNLLLNPNKSPISIQNLNELIHGTYPYPTPESLIGVCEVCIPLFEATFGKIQ